MGRFLKSLSAGLAAAFIAGAALAGVQVQLKPRLVAEAGPVTLGDLFDNAGRASGVFVARAPAPGGNVVLDAVKVQQIAYANGLEWANPNGYSRLVVKGPAAAGATATAAPPGRTVQALTWARNIAVGEIISAEDLVWGEVQSHQVAPDAPRDAEGVIGQAAKRPLRMGAAVSGKDTAAAQVIKKGDLIAVTFSDGGISLTLQAQALQSAAAGESLSVLNPQSKKTIVAVATGPGTAAVGPEADSLKASRFAPSR